MLKWKFDTLTELQEEFGENGTLNLCREERMII
jgi:hypothetical protein